MVVQKWSSARVSSKNLTTFAALIIRPSPPRRFVIDALDERRHRLIGNRVVARGHRGLAQAFQKPVAHLAGDDVALPTKFPLPETV